MSYYILPKNINNINVSPQYSNELCCPYVSKSLLNYYNKLKIQLDDMFIDDYDLSNNCLEDAFKIINPYEFIFSQVPGSKFSVSKLKQKNNIFYDLLEIYSNLNIFDSFKEINTINALHISQNYDDSIECFEIFREGFKDNHYSSNSIDINNDLIGLKMDFIFYEAETEDIYNYFISLVQAVIAILRNQKHNGISIIKIGNVFHKPVVDILYYLCSLYDKVYISKPNTNNITSFERYIVCKSFIYNEQSLQYLKLNYLKLLIFIKKLEDKHIKSILDFDIPYYFKNKIDDLNIIIGQQQLEALNQIITIYKNKNKSDKIEIIKKNNIQKSVSWCEKYKIPCNKFAEKINMFLPIINETLYQI
jgi:hypothetical protein